MQKTQDTSQKSLTCPESISSQVSDDILAGTIADQIWDEWKRYGKPLTLKQKLREYENLNRIKNW